MRTIKSVKKQIKEAAKNFGLKFDSRWFSYIWVPNKIEILSEYLGNCPDPLYQKYGRSSTTRIENFDRFVRSKDYISLLKRYGGQVAHKEHISQEISLLPKIIDKKLKEELTNFYLQLEKKFQLTDSVAVIARPKTFEQKDWQLKYCLRHEWIHILLEKNKINFQEINTRWWAYDEGLNEYIGEFIDDNIENLEKIREEEEFQMEKKYLSYAIKFRRLFKDKHTPQERRQEIEKLLRRFKQKERTLLSKHHIY